MVWLRNKKTHSYVEVCNMSDTYGEVVILDQQRITQVTHLIGTVDELERTGLTLPLPIKFATKM